MFNHDFMHSTLVPVDFSEASLAALDHAIAVSQIFNDRKPIITLVHIIEGANFEPVSRVEAAGESFRDALAIEGAINRFEKIINKHSTENVEFKYIIAGGKPYRKIVDIAREINADGIIMGTHGSSGIQIIAGSNASRVIQTAPCPVVVIKSKPSKEGYKNIVLPLDLTKETKQKVNFAAQVAVYCNATVHIISMVDNDEFLKRRLQNNLIQVENYLKSKEIKTTSTMLDIDSSNFAMQMLAWAEGKNADLVVIMTQSERSFGDYFFGTYAQQIVNKSSIPVMTIRPNPVLEGIVEGNVGTSASAY
jgi:nucleotide-binding universal stress UspA family protein